MKGDLAIGHVRYSTSGNSSLENAQPLLIKYRRGSIAISHNGNLVNGVELRQSLEDKGSIFQTTTDSELIAHLIAREQDGDIEEAIAKAVPHLQGAYTFAIMTETSLIGLRDYYGIRPLSLGKIEGGGYVLSSETCAFDTIGAEFIRDIQPGEMVVIDRGGIRSRTVAAETGKAICIFEYIYFARPDSNIEGKNVHLVRKELGRQVAREHPLEADIVIGVPDSSIAAASGLAEELGLPYEVGFIKNRYIGRTFIQPDQKARDL
ncbi:class II glutamine amidotransferase, partial [candidate division NPL-UPA2 bacterium]|nr:class II glutamine amidotransferase [candidate division NPL-UPA2 bacterium]